MSVIYIGGQGGGSGGGGGGGGGGDLNEIIVSLSYDTNLELVLDFGDSTCYPGTGQDITDLDSSQAWRLGGSNGADSSDPTFNGTAGDLSEDEYFALDGGDFVMAKSAPSWVQNFHKNNATFTILALFYIGAGSTQQYITGSVRNGSSSHGFLLGLDSSDKLTLDIYGSGSGVLSQTSDAAVTTGAWRCGAVSIDEAGGNVSFLWENGSYKQVSAANTFDAAYTSPSTAGS